MWSKIVGWFKPRQPLRCGGEGICEFISGGKVCGTIRYRRPTSDEKLDYIYQYQTAVVSETRLKEIRDAKNKEKKCHEILRDLSIPMARVIFLGSSGFIDEDGKPIDNLGIEQQFDIISKYFGYALVDLVAKVYATDGIVKKKY